MAAIIQNWNHRIEAIVSTQISPLILQSNVEQESEFYLKTRSGNPKRSFVGQPGSAAETRPSQILGQIVPFFEY
jgi:hypothetical protein